MQSSQRWITVTESEYPWEREALAFIRERLPDTSHTALGRTSSSWRLGDYRVDELLFEGPTYQDWAATHVALEKDGARVWIYVVGPGASEEARASIVRAARREYAILNGISHPGILKAKAYTEHERGPALVFEHTPGAQRFDHFLAERGDAGEQADVFSLGALAYRLFSGEPASRSFSELAEKLREGKGRQISSLAWLIEREGKELGLRTRALNAVERVNLRSVRDLLHYPLAQLRRLRGVGSKTRRELAGLTEALATRFPETAAKPKQVPVEAVQEAPGGAEGVSVDMLAAMLVLAARRQEAKASAQAVEALLGLDGDPSLGRWPSQSDASRHMGVKPATVSQAVAKARKRWLKLPAMTQLREDITVMLEAQGMVMTMEEIADALLASRGSVQPDPVRTRQATAVVRAAVETERDRAAPRWIGRRVLGGERVLLARDELAEDGDPTTDGEKLADFAEALGGRADALAGEEPLRPPARVLEALQAVESPKGVLRAASSRLLQLAAATSDGAALSSRLELYPGGMSAARALKLALGALAGARELSPEQVRERVAGRYPEAETLPERPALDELLDKVGSERRWRPDARGGAGAYVAPLLEFTTVSSATSLARATTVAARFEEVPAAQVEVEEFERRLRYSVEQQRFLALTVAPQRAALAEQALAERFPVEVRSLDGLLIRHMKNFAAQRRIDWPTVLRADALPARERAMSRDWGNLQRVVRSVLPRVKAELAAARRHVLLTNPGLLTRYGQMDFLGELREEAGTPGGQGGLWVLVPTDGQQQKLSLDGDPVPVFTSAQWAQIPDTWLLVHVGQNGLKQALVG